MPSPESPPSGHLAQPAPGGPPAVPPAFEGLRREQARLLQRAQAMRDVLRSTPGELPPGRSAEELSRTLMYDTLATLTRAEVVIEHGAEALLEVTERDLALRGRELEAKLKEIDLRERELAAGVVREQRTWSIVSGAFSGAGALLMNAKVLAGIGTLLAAAGGAIATYFGLPWASHVAGYQP